MNDCPSGEQLHAYSDGRVDAAARVAIDRHLAECEPCTLELSRLTALSQLLAGTARPRLSQIARHRLHAQIDATIERASEKGLIRIGWSLSGIAASVLVIGSAMLMRTPLENSATPTQSTPPWVAVANTTSSDSDSSASQVASTPVAEYYLADATASSSEPQ